MPDVPEFDELINQADGLAAKGEDYLRQGMPASAHQMFVEACLYTNIAYTAQQSLAAYLNGGLPAAEKFMNDTASPSFTKIQSMFDELKTKKPSTMADITVIAAAYGEIAIAQGVIDKALDTLGSANPSDGTEESELDQFEVITLAAIYFGLANYAIDTADDIIAFGAGSGKAKPADKAKVKRLSEAFRKAAEANLNYFDNVLLRDIAEAQGVSLGVIKQAFMANENDYLLAVSAKQSSHLIKDRLGDSEAVSYAVLGTSLESFIISSALIAKYYSLEYELDDEGNNPRVSREKALIEMLDFGQKKAEEDINAAKKIGAEPVMVVVNYEAAKNAREGDIDMKIDALADFWSASMHSRALQILSQIKVKRGGESGFTKLLGN
ncbi:MAG: hypothetical protein IBX64_13490 [Actinobacteria bacterium]|nr:hypothetical protein [Actinomycetota bacterium]